MTETVDRKTALYEEHVRLGARIVSFGGFLMPLQYTGQIAEHRAVRTGLGLFDLSHMGEFRIRGAGAPAAVDRLVTNRILGTEPGRVVYSPMCRPEGGIVDDLLVYHLAPDEVLLVVNASNIAKDRAWVREHLPNSLEFTDESEGIALVAVQGPRVEPFLDPMTPTPLADLAYYSAVRSEVAGIPVLLSRTGYTGEDGFELYVASDRAPELWGRLREAGGEGLTPVGLAARDTLRFEMGYCLYGNDIDETTNPLEAGLGWTVKFKKDAFVAKEALEAVRAAGVTRRLVGLDPGGGRAVPRKGYPILADGKPVGSVTSGTFAPSVGRGLALGYVARSHSGAGAAVGIDIRGRVVDAAVTRPPFYTSGSRKTH